jgi:mannosyltransferase
MSNKRVFLISIFGGALVFRLLGISSRPLWYDEAFAVLFAEQGPQAMLSGTLTPVGGAAADVHPLAYYTTLWAWMSAFGNSPLVVRMLSVIAGLGLIGLVYHLTRELFGERIGLVPTALVALSPFQIHYAQEVRMYALMAFFLIAATLAIWMAIETDKVTWWMMFSASAALAQYTHNLSVFYLLPLAATPILLRKWRSLPRVAMAGLGAIGLYFPWLLLVPAQFAKVQSAYWTTRPGLERLVTTLLSFVTNLPLPDPWLLVGVFTSLLIFVLAAWQTYKALRTGSRHAMTGLWLAYLAIMPPLALFAFSQWQPIYIERALLPSGVMFSVWVGWALVQTEIPKPVSSVAFSILVVGMAFGIYQQSAYRGFPYAPYAELDTYLASSVRADEIIMHSNKLTMLPAVYYDQDLPQRYLADPPGSGADTLAEPTQRVLGLLAYPSLESATGGAKRVWFVIFERAVREYKDLGQKTHPHLAWLGAHYELERVENWDEVDLYVYGPESGH